MEAHQSRWLCYLKGMPYYMLLLCLLAYGEEYGMELLKVLVRHFRDLHPITLCSEYSALHLRRRRSHGDATSSRAAEASLHMQAPRRAFVQTSCSIRRDVQQDSQFSLRLIHHNSTMHPGMFAHRVLVIRMTKNTLCSGLCQACEIHTLQICDVLRWADDS